MYDLCNHNFYRRKPGTCILRPEAARWYYSQGTLLAAVGRHIYLRLKAARFTESHFPLNTEEMVNFSIYVLNSLEILQLGFFHMRL